MFRLVFDEEGQREKSEFEAVKRVKLVEERGWTALVERHERSTEEAPKEERGGREECKRKTVKRK